MVLVCFGVFPLWIMNDLPNSSWFPPRPSMLNFPTLYRVCHLPGYFGWVDLDLERIAALLQVMNVNFFVCKSLPGSSPSPSSSSSRSLPMLIKLFLCHFFKAFILLNECWRVDFSNVGMIWSMRWCVRPWQSPQPVPFPLTNVSGLILFAHGLQPLACWPQAASYPWSLGQGYNHLPITYARHKIAGKCFPRVSPELKFRRATE